MGYSTGMLKHRIRVLNRDEAVDSAFGLDAEGIEWRDDGCLWASVDFVRGKRAMNAGAVDVYGVVMVRCRWNTIINERSRIEYGGRIYNVLGETLHTDRQENIVQFQAQVVVDEVAMT